MFELLNATDKDNITSWIRAYAPYNDGTPAAKVPVGQAMMPLDYILRHWNSAKVRGLRDLFGSNLILRKNYSYTLSQGSILSKLEKKLAKTNDFSKLHNLWEIIILNEAVFNDHRYEMRNICSPYTFVKGNCEDIFDNGWRLFADRNEPADKRWSFQLAGRNKPYLLYPAMKPMKVMRQILEVYGDKYNSEWKEWYENVRLDVSRVLNNANLHGELCLSIHPLDYMTMSDNENEWSSCMRWRRNGEYCQGTIEMMNSPVVVVAYLHNPKNPMTLPNGNKWDNKIWRQLWVVDEDIITEVKAYPYDDENISQYVYTWLRDLATQAWGSDYDMATTIDGDECAITIADDTEVIYNFETGFMYNDFGCAPREHITALDTKKIVGKYRSSHWRNDTRYYVDVEYSGRSECIWCGEDITRDWNDDYDEEDESLHSLRVCNFCSGLTTCYYCGERYPADCMTEIDGIMLCSSCVDECVVSDAFTGVAMYNGNNDVDIIHLATGNEENYEFTGDIIYTRSIDDIPDYDTYFTHPLRERSRWWAIEYFLLVDDLTDEGRRIFDYYPD